MRIFVPRETSRAETRAAVVPATAAKLVKLGAEVVVEAGLGAPGHFSDDEYRKASAVIAPDRGAALATADMVLRLGKPPADEIARLRRGCIHISYLDPFN